MEQLVFLLILAAISFIQWILQKSAEHKQQRQLQREREKAASPSGSVQEAPWAKREPTPEDQMRELFEALGLPIPEEEPDKPQTARQPQRGEPHSLSEPELELPAEATSQPTLAREPHREEQPTPPPIPQEMFAPSPAPIPVSIEGSISEPAQPSFQENQELIELAKRLQRAEEAAQAAVAKAERTPFRSLLASPQTLRQAIILCEILGPPKALREESATSLLAR